MIDAHHLFSTYSPCVGNLKVKIAEGTLSSVAGKGSIRIFESITLNPVLHVPNLSYNLLFISQLTKQSNCLAKFLPSHCVFQDLLLGKTIGSAKECEGLYYLTKLMCVDSVLVFVILHLVLGKVNFCYGTKGWVMLVFSTCNIYFLHYVQIKLHGIFSVKCVNLPNTIVHFS